MKKIIVPSIVCLSLILTVNLASAQKTEDTTKVKKMTMEKRSNVGSKDTLQQKITVNDDGVQSKRKFKKNKNSTTKPEEINPAVKKED